MQQQTHDKNSALIAQFSDHECVTKQRAAPKKGYEACKCKKQFFYNLTLRLVLLRVHKQWGHALHDEIAEAETEGQDREVQKAVGVAGSVVARSGRGGGGREATGADGRAVGSSSGHGRGSRGGGGRGGGSSGGGRGSGLLRRAGRARGRGGSRAGGFGGRTSCAAAASASATGLDALPVAGVVGVGVFGATAVVLDGDRPDHHGERA